jgi:hypothetical protein
LKKLSFLQFSKGRRNEGKERKEEIVGKTEGRVGGGREGSHQPGKQGRLGI